MSTVTPRANLLHELFEAQVERTPQALAVVCGDTHITYEGLNRRANAVARRLRTSGIDLEQRVAVYCERSAEAIAGILGVLKAGAAYVPIDPSYPSTHIEFLLEDSAPAALVTWTALASEVWSIDLPMVMLDDITEESSESLQVSGLSPSALAYVFYTSGSTGRPKGVMVEHRSVCNLAVTQADRFHLKPGDRVLQFAPMSFDASVSEIFVSLCRGAVLCVPTPGSLLIGNTLAAILTQYQITHVTLPPSILRSIPPTTLLPSVQVMVSAGEACRESLVNDWAPGRCFINAYGPTEATVCATMGECPAHAPYPPGIGFPLENVTVYILDEDGLPTGIGVIGEICIGGIGVARGYLNRRDATIEKFIPDPFSREPNARYYKTGDLGRRRADGQVEYVGRRDQQAKVRGFRIEPAAIELKLNAHPLVKDSLVLAERDDSGEAMLAAYVIAVTSAGDARSSDSSIADSVHRSLDVPSLREYLRKEIPEYMVPTAIVLVDDFPLTPNGKVDRERLVFLRTQRQTPTVRPECTEVERELMEIWRHLLNVDQPTPEDNFFDLGGNSYLCLKLANDVAKRFSLAIRDVAVYQYPTLGGLARYIEDALRVAKLEGEARRVSG